MKTVKQVLSKDRELSLESDSKILESLVHLGLLEPGRANLVKRAMYTNTDAMTMAEKKSMIGLMESLITHVMHEKKDHLAALDTRRAPGYPSERDIPVVLILKRKALRVYPDNQKVAMYYSQALDKYISIPFGPQSDELGIHMNEETKEEMRKIKFGSHDTVEIKESAPTVTFRNKLDSIREERDESLEENLVKIGQLIAKGASVAGNAASATGSAIKQGVQAGSNAIKTFRANRAANKEAAKEVAAKASRKKARQARRASGATAAEVTGGGIADRISSALRSSDNGPSAIRQAGSTAADAGSYDFTGPGKSQASISGPLGNPNAFQMSTPNNALTRRAELDSRRTNESTNLDVIRSIVDNDLKEDTVSFGDNRISINNRTAKKIIGIHESLNKTNQRKFEKMLNENAVSFRKAINFVVKVR